MVVVKSSPTVIGLVTFLVHTKVLGYELSAATGFTALALFNQLRMPLIVLPDTINYYIQVRCCSVLFGSVRFGFDLFWFGFFTVRTLALPDVRRQDSLDCHTPGVFSLETYRSQVDFPPTILRTILSPVFSLQLPLSPGNHSDV